MFSVSTLDLVEEGICLPLFRGLDMFASFLCDPLLPCMQDKEPIKNIPIQDILAVSECGR